MTKKNNSKPIIITEKHIFQAVLVLQFFTWLLLVLPQLLRGEKDENIFVLTLSMLSTLTLYLSVYAKKGKTNDTKN
jgi:asparagine N-glycosylation enzyme membrane subunit Stt3